MNERAVAREQKRIVRMIDRWRPLLGLTEWMIDVTCHGGVFVNQEGNASKNAVGTTLVDWQYMRANIAFNAVELAAFTDSQAEMTVVHELCHVLVNEMRAQNLPPGWERNVEDNLHVPSKAVQQRLMGIDWMTEREMYEAIPPAYGEWVGRQLMEALK